MENFVNKAAAFFSEILAEVRPEYVFAACAALALIALAVQMLAAKAATPTIGDYRRVKRFVVKRGEIVSSNAHRFYKKCVVHMGRRVRRAWKKHTLSGREYAGSALKFEMDRHIARDRRIPSVYLPCAFAAVALLQTILLCKGMQWTEAVAYAAAGAVIWAVLAILPAIYCSIRKSASRKAAAKLATVIDAKLTLRPSEGKLYLYPEQAPSAVVVAAPKARTLADAVDEYLAAHPSKEVAKVVQSGVEKAGACACKNAAESAALGEAAGKLKKYTA